MADRQLAATITDRAKGCLEEAMKNLNLSAQERRGIKMGKKNVEGAKEEEWHAVGKVLLEKAVSVDSIQQTLGKIWCQDRGMLCKEMGDNIFLF